MSERLFDVGPTVESVSLSADARRTARRNEAIANGKHPLRLDPLREPAGETCGSCKHLTAHGHNLRTYYKCNLRPHEVTFGAATDVRLSWPACIRWEADPDDE